MNYKFTIKGTLPGLNELIEAERRNRQCGAKLKKQCEAVVMNAARQMGGAEIQEPELDPLGKQIIDCFMNGGKLEDFEAITPTGL